MQQMLSLAQAAALAGGAEIRSRADDFGVARTKGSSIDFVTEADVAAGVAIVETISALLPSAAFVIEEDEVHDITGAPRGNLLDDEVWVVDPLDGTSSFVHGYPFYSVSIALLHRGRPIVGAVYGVPADELFSAAEGQGAFLGNTRLHCDQESALANAMLVTGFPYDRGALFDRQHKILGHFMRLPIHGIRRDGSAALDCTHVASGRADGFWEFGLKPWDMAAGVVICREAGALVTGIDGEPWSTESTGIIVANPALHAEITRTVQGTQA